MASISQRKAALKAFLAANPGLKKAPWEKASGLSEGTVRGFLNRANTMTDDTYEKLAAGAAEILGRDVKAAELRGEAPSDAKVPVRSYVGAGGEVIAIEDQEPIDWVPAPPGMENAEATEVRGNSMRPLYHDGDLLFHIRRIDIDLGEYEGEVVVTQVKDGGRLVKILKPGSRRNRFTLESVNQAFDPIHDQQLDWIGPIEWVHKRWRKKPRLVKRPG